MTSNSEVPLIVCREIPARRRRIFEAFSDHRSLSRWFTPSAEIPVEVLVFDFTIGGKFRFRWRLPDGRSPVVGGIFEIIQEPEEISMSWVWEAPDPLEGIPMRVTFRFLENGDATEVVVTHEGIPSDMACTVQADGWEGTLACLNNFFEKAASG